jgi:hypothetical protein
MIYGAHDLVTVETQTDDSDLAISSLNQKAVEGIFRVFFEVAVK